MSRCFPFPPPGYERKHDPEDLDLLKELKRKEKKHKKEKKDKERKKDKKEKDGGDEKHKEKKDRKEKHRDKKDKHRDKKKDKEDRGKDKDKSSISEESTVAGKSEEQSGGKLHTTRDGKASSFTHFPNQNGGKPSLGNLSSQGIEDSKFVQELDRRIGEEKIGRGSQLPKRVGLVDTKDQEMSVKAALLRDSLAVQAEEKNDNRNKKTERKMDPQGLGNDYSGNILFPNTTVMSQSKVEQISRPLDGQNGRKLEDKEKYKEICDVNQGNRQNDIESHFKEEKRLEVAKMKNENKKSEHDNLNGVRNNLDAAISSASHGPILSWESNNNVTEANIRKRKDMETNGFLHESEIRPNKMQKPALHRLTENGRKHAGLPTPSETPNDKHATHNSIRVSKRDQLANCMVESNRSSPSKPKSSPAAMSSDQIAKAPKLPPIDSKFSSKLRDVPDIDDQIAEASRRPPHPDSKYLAEVLTVPKMVDWPVVDDQDWLFSKKSTSTGSKMGSVSAKGDPVVWAEAVHLESVDVCALPYVIPY